MPDKYRRDGTAYPNTEAGLLEWAADLSNPEIKIVQQTWLETGFMVSTVWLGLDHNFSQSGPPLIFETMLFCDGVPEDYQERYSTEDDAIIGHFKAVEQFSAKPIKKQDS